jgi:hypothetical protein
MRPLVAPLVVFLLALAAREAAAIPSFARRYDAPCALCHAPAPPALGAFGRRFKENGYQLAGDAERAAREAHAQRPNPDEPLELLRVAPLALRAVSRAVVTPDPRGAAGDPAAARPAPLELRPFESLYLLAGASVYPDVSFFAAATIGRDAAIHHAAVGFHNLLSPDGHLNLRVGRLLLLDFARPEHRTLTSFGNPIATTRVGLNPTTLDSTQPGLEAYGRLLGRRLFYRFAVLQGAPGPDGSSDLDAHKDLFGELQVTPHHLVTLGALGHRGRTQITDDSGGVAVRFTDRFHAWGGWAEVAAAPIDLFAQALRVNHADPAGGAGHTNYWAFRAEARAPLGPRVYVVARYDQLGSHHLADFQRATVHVGALLLSNLRLFAESQIPLERVEASAVVFALDLAL